MINLTGIKLLTCIFIINYITLSGQDNINFFNENEIKISENLYAYNFKIVDSLINLSSKSNNNSLNITYINYFWWHIISGNDSVYFSKKAIEKADDGIKILDLKDKKHLTNEDIYSLIIFYAFKARFEILNNNYIKALRFLQKSISYINISVENIKEFENFKLTTGLYYYTISHIVEKYPLFYPYILFFPKGNKYLGISYLKECLSSKDVVVRTEAKYFLMKIYLESEEKLSVSEIYAKSLLKEYPNNMVFHYYYYKLLYLQNKILESKQQLDIMIDNAKNNNQLNKKQKTHFINIINEKLYER